MRAHRPVEGRDVSTEIAVGRVDYLLPGKNQVTDRKGTGEGFKSRRGSSGMQIERQKPESIHMGLCHGIFMQNAHIAQTYPLDREWTRGNRRGYQNGHEDQG